jgi:hypothetical protein
MPKNEQGKTVKLSLIVHANNRADASFITATIQICSGFSR